jgi:hypothetical protein
LGNTMAAAGFREVSNFFNNLLQCNPLLRQSLFWQSGPLHLVIGFAI